MEKNLILSIFLVTISVASIPLAHAEMGFSFKFGELGTDGESLGNPTDVIVGSDGREIYVVDKNSNRINVFEHDGDHKFEYGTFCDMALIQDCNDGADGAKDDGDGQFNSPLSMALDSFGKFFVVDAGNHRIQVFDGNGKFLFKFGSSDSGNDEYLEGAEGVVIQDETRDIFVSNSERDSISVFNAAGSFEFSFGSFNQNDEFVNPSSMVIDNPNDILYVADSGNDRVVMFEIVAGTTCPGGTVKSVDGICYVKEFGTRGGDRGEFHGPAGLAFDDSNGILYVADSVNNRIQAFEIIDGITCPSGTQEIVDGVCFVEEFGVSGTGDGEFDTPMGISLDRTNGLLFVSDSNNGRIQAITLGSEPAVMTPERPKNPKVSPVSPTSIILTWDEPELGESVPEITGYKIEYKVGSGDYSTISENTQSKTTSFIHHGLEENETYYYRVYSINSEGTSDASSLVSEKPDHTTTPAALTATAISPSQIKLSWMPPSQTFGQAIGGYEIKREIIDDVYDSVGDTNGQTTTFIVSGLATDKTYTYAVVANIGFGETEESNTASATPREDSTDASEGPITATEVQVTTSSPPIKLRAETESAKSVKLTWSEPTDDGNSEITGYKIESKRDDGRFSTVLEDTQSRSGTYVHSGLVTDSKYTYRVSAINAAGTSEPSNESTATPRIAGLEISPVGTLSIDEGKLLSFTVKLTDSAIKDRLVFGLKNAPAGAKIISDTGMFTWTPTSSDGGKTYTFDVEVRRDGMFDSKSLVVNVNDSIKGTEPVKEPKAVKEPEESGLAPFVDESKDPQSYVERYNNEAGYRDWFDKAYPEYDSIYQAVGLEEPLEVPAPFVDESKDPQSYVERYNNEAGYKKWFDENYPEYDSIYQAVGLEEPLEVPAPFVDESKDPQSYVERYNNEAGYKKWFDENYPEYDSIYQAVGSEEPSGKEQTVEEPSGKEQTVEEPSGKEQTVEEPEPKGPEPEKRFGFCGHGTKLIDGVCTIVQKPVQKSWWQFW